MVLQKIFFKLHNAILTYFAIVVNSFCNNRIFVFSSKQSLLVAFDLKNFENSKKNGFAAFYKKLTTAAAFYKKFADDTVCKNPDFYMNFTAYGLFLENAINTLKIVIESTGVPQLKYLLELTSKFPKIDKDTDE